MWSGPEGVKARAHTASLRLREEGFSEEAMLHSSSWRTRRHTSLRSFQEAGETKVGHHEQTMEALSRYFPGKAQRNTQ